MEKKEFYSGQISGWLVPFSSDDRARMAGVEWFNGKKMTYTTGRKSFSTTKSTKRGFGNRCG